MRACVLQAEIDAEQQAAHAVRAAERALIQAARAMGGHPADELAALRSTYARWIAGRRSATYDLRRALDRVSTLTPTERMMILTREFLTDEQAARALNREIGGLRSDRQRASVKALSTLEPQRWAEVKRGRSKGPLEPGEVAVVRSAHEAGAWPVFDRNEAEAWMLLRRHVSDTRDRVRHVGWREGVGWLGRFETATREENEAARADHAVRVEAAREEEQRRNDRLRAEFAAWREGGGQPRDARSSTRRR